MSGGNYGCFKKLAVSFGILGGLAVISVTLMNILGEEVGICLSGVVVLAFYVFIFMLGGAGGRSGGYGLDTDDV